MKKSWLAFSLSGLFGIGLLLPSLTLGSPIEPGFDLFKTPAYEVDLGPPIDKIELVGNSKPLTSENLGKTDTIIERKTGISPFDEGDVGTVEIQVKVLSLKSAHSLDGGVLGLPGMVDLYVVINALDLPSLPLTNVLTTHSGEMIAPSNGSIEIKHDYEDGNIHSFGNRVEGTFKSNLPNIEAFLIVVTAGEALSTNKSDWLHSQTHSIALSSTGWWSHEKPVGNWNNEKYPAGEFYIVSPGTNPATGKIEPPIIHTGPHPVIVSPVIFDQPLTATLLSNNTIGLIWVTGMEGYMAGFVTYRGKLKNEAGACTDNVNDYAAITMISWEDSQVGSSNGGASYSVIDPDGESNSCYGLVAVGFDGTFEVQTTKVSE
jgi:hypothetical protein